MTGKSAQIIKFLLDQDKEKEWDLKEHKEKRSLDANGMLWACLQEIAEAVNSDKWTIYLQMLKRYGKYDYVIVKEKAVEAMKRQWREIEEVGEIDVHGQKAVQLLCYYGSSTYNRKEFSVLLDGVISEMKEVGLMPPPDRQTRELLERWKA
jgi:hypothetical protein